LKLISRHSAPISGKIARGHARCAIRPALSELFASLAVPTAIPMRFATALEARLFADACTKRGHRRQVEPDWATIHRELKRKHVTLSILWDEYIERHPGGYRLCAPKIRFG
jgi:transposase